MKLYWKDGRVYFKGSVPKKFQQYVQGRIDFTHEITIPLSPRKADTRAREWDDNYIAEFWNEPFGGSEAEDDRIKRNWFFEIISEFLSAPDNTAWCIVGTAEYQLGLNLSIQS